MTGNLKHLHRNELGKVCFANDAAYSYSKDLANRTVSDKIFIDKTCEIPRNRKYDGYQRTSASIVYKFFDKKIRSEMIVNEQLAVELHKPVIKTINRRKVYVRFKNNIWAVDLAE